METIGRRALGKGGLIAAAGLVALSACASPPPARPANHPAAPVRTPVSATERPYLSEPGVRAVDADMCKAGELQWLVGKPRSQIPVPVDVVNRRVACTTCPVTEDYSPYRLNIFYNQQTGLVEQVRCG